MGAAFAFEGLEAVKGSTPACSGGLRNPSLHPKVAQPFPQGHVCHLLTLELGWAQQRAQE